MRRTRGCASQTQPHGRASSSQLPRRVHQRGHPHRYIPRSLRRQHPSLRAPYICTSLVASLRARLTRIRGRCGGGRAAQRHGPGHGRAHQSPRRRGRDRSRARRRRRRRCIVLLTGCCPALTIPAASSRCRCRQRHLPCLYQRRPRAPEGRPWAAPPPRLCSAAPAAYYSGVRGRGRTGRTALLRTRRREGCRPRSLALRRLLRGSAPRRSREGCTGARTRDQANTAGPGPWARCDDPKWSEGPFDTE